MPSVFISWSGDSSRRAAEVLYTWLPVALQSIKPFLSSEDLKKGGRWQTDLTAELAKESFGIVCLTPSNLSAPWILFEAGALSKSLGDGQVAPFLLSVKPSDLPAPLTQFNAVFAEREDFKRLLKSINDRVPEDAVDGVRIDRAVDALWPSIEAELKAAEEQPPPKTPEKKPTQDADGIVSRLDPILQELLVLNRQQTQMLSRNDGAMLATRQAELQSEMEARREYDRSVLAPLLQQFWLTLDTLRDEGLAPASRSELARLEEMTISVASRYELASPRSLQLRRRRHAQRDFGVELPIESAPRRLQGDRGMSFAYKKSGEPPFDEFTSRLGRVGPLQSLSRTERVVSTQFAQPLSEGQRQDAKQIADEMGFEEIAI